MIERGTTLLRPQPWDTTVVLVTTVGVQIGGRSKAKMQRRPCSLAWERLHPPNSRTP